MSCRPSVIDSYLATSCDENPFGSFRLYALAVDELLGRRARRGAAVGNVRRGAVVGTTGLSGARRRGVVLRPAERRRHRQRHRRTLGHLATGIDEDDLVRDALGVLVHHDLDLEIPALQL